jgi:hypothetical protein
MALWANSASVVWAEHGLPLTKHRFILKPALNVTEAVTRLCRL